MAVENGLLLVLIVTLISALVITIIIIRRNRNNIEVSPGHYIIMSFLWSLFGSILSRVLFLPT